MKEKIKQRILEMLENFDKKTIKELHTETRSLYSFIYYHGMMTKKEKDKLKMDGIKARQKKAMQALANNNQITKHI